MHMAKWVYMPERVTLAVMIVGLCGVQDQMGTHKSVC